MNIFLDVFPFDKYNHISPDPLSQLFMEYGFLPHLRYGL